MKHLLTLASTLFCFALSGAEIPYYYDYGYPPPADYETGDLGKFIVGAEWLYLKPSAEGCRGDWDSGFRAHAGYALPLDKWTLDAAYMYYRTNVNEWWKWQYNQLDVDLSRVSFFNRSISVTPRMGFRTIWSKQQLSRIDDRFNAAGIKFGLDTTWELGLCGLSIYGNFDYSLLFGCHELKQLTTLDAGLQWITDFDCYERFLIVKAGWKTLFLPDFGLFSDNLGLYGFVLGASFYF